MTPKKVDPTQTRLNFVDMQDERLYEWKAWFDEHNEQMFESPRQRSYFRINAANMKAEIAWRNSTFPF